MKKSSKNKVILQFVLLVILVVILSTISTKIWKGKPEEIPENKVLIFQEAMTIAEFGNINKLPNPLLKEVFGLETKQELQKDLAEMNFSREEISAMIDKALALQAEYESKNWVKIPVKFGLWITFLIAMFIIIRKAKITPVNRKWLYVTAIAVFGIVMGSDPSPMGTVKDAIVLYGMKGVIFPPRMVALAIFLVMVLLANKLICSWGCQFGTLQDLVFRLNRNPKNEKGIFRQYKLPFVVTNTIRIAFFTALIIVSFLWATDMVESIDPFKIFKPGVITAFGGLFIGIVLVAGLLVYRPWCYIFCPFGLVGGLVEKISIFKIKVDYTTCIACEKCANACPSTVMSTILKREQVISDCFTCGVCIEVCPTDSVRFLSGKREKPPEGKFRVIKGS